MAISHNYVCCVGYMGGDPTRARLPSGTEVVNFSVGVSERYQDQDHTEWFRVSCYNDKSVEFVDKYLRKGDPVLVEGKFRTRKYVDNTGQERSITDLIANRITSLGTKEQSDARGDARGDPRDARGDDRRAPARDDRRDDRRAPADDRRAPADDRRAPPADDRRAPPADDRRAPPRDDRRPPADDRGHDDRRAPADDRGYDDRRAPAREAPREAARDDRRPPARDAYRDDRRPPATGQRVDPELDDQVPF